MAIEFHCDHCGKRIRTTEEHAGRRAKCPYCKQSVYVPTPRDQIEPLDLAPLDEREEQARDAMLRETTELAHRILRDRELPPETSAAPPPASRDVVRPRLDMESLVIQYARCMADGDLPTAEELAAEIRADRAGAEEVIDRMTMDQMLPRAIANIPRPVLMGFFKRLREG